MKTYDQSPRTAARLEKAFRSHPASQDQQPRLEAINERLLQIARFLCSITPDSDEQGTMLAKLQEAKYWASEAIAKNEA